MPGTLYIPRGLPASGKTSWARRKLDLYSAGEAVRLNRDDIRAMSLPSDYRIPQHNAEETVSAVQKAPIVDLLRAGVDVIVDDTNLRLRYVRQFAQLAEKAGAQWECVDTFLSVPVEECIARDAMRARPVGEQVIRGTHTKFLSGRWPLPVPVLDVAVSGKPYTPVPGTPRAVMVDIDGTVADHGTRNPYDTSLYHEDTPIVAVVETVRMAHAAGHAVVYCSGRAADFRDVTEAWLTEHVQVPGPLFMRPSGDTRNDAIVKLELFDEHIRDHYDVRFVLDDRDRVVKCWRSLGLTVYQVAPGDF